MYLLYAPLGDSNKEARESFTVSEKLEFWYLSVGHPVVLGVCNS